MKKKVISVLMAIVLGVAPVMLSQAENVQAAVVNKYHGTVRRGDTGEAVGQLQTWMNYLSKNYGKPEWNCGKVDNIFGSQTESAVRAFQSAYKSKCGGVDGICGPKTWAVMESLVS